MRLHYMFRVIMYCIIYKKICNENEQWGMPLISSYYMEFGITYKKTRRTL